MKTLIKLCFALLSIFSALFAKAAVDEPHFLALFQRVIDANSAKVSELGGILTMKARYDLNMFVAVPLQMDGKWIVEIWGAYPKRPLMTEDGMQFLVCHVLGHHLGGLPRKASTSTSKWASAEGQADDYAARVCLRDLWQNDGVVEVSDVPVTLKSACDLKWGEASPRSNLCQRIVIAARVFFDATNGGVGLARQPLVNLDTPDPTIVTETQLDHPNDQCRLDTVKNAALDQSRPACWFKETP